MILRYQIIALVIMGIFYVVYFGKMLMQRKQGITTNKIAKDKSDKGRYRVEVIMKVATVVIVAAELASIIYGHSVFRYSLKVPAIVIGLLGDAFFLAAVITMKDSWRAGVAADEHRPFVANGVFKISRNPAFLGFDLVYISILLMFFNWILFVFTLWPVIMLHLQILQEEKYLAGEFGDEYTAYKKTVFRYFGRKKQMFWAAISVICAITAVIMIISINKNSEQLTKMSSGECIEYTAKGNSDACITVGVLKDGKMYYTVFGENGAVLQEGQFAEDGVLVSQTVYDKKGNVISRNAGENGGSADGAAPLHIYEIGSLTKTMTAACIKQAIDEGKVKLSDTIDMYLDLPGEGTYPTIEALLTHTSGYKGEYLEPHIMFNTVIDQNPFHFISAETILKQAEKHRPTGTSYEWSYSNFGYALLGQIIEKVYEADYEFLINTFTDWLGMYETEFTDEDGDLSNYWKWDLKDAYAPAGAVKSNIKDMLIYASKVMSDARLEGMDKPLRAISQKNASYEALGINIDKIGMAWILDEKNGYMWHNGATADYNSYLGICKEKGTAVVVLSNLPSNYRIPATVIGTKLLGEVSR